MIGDADIAGVECRIDGAIRIKPRYATPRTAVGECLALLGDRQSSIILTPICR